MFDLKNIILHFNKRSTPEPTEDGKASSTAGLKAPEHSRHTCHKTADSPLH